MVFNCAMATSQDYDDGKPTTSPCPSRIHCVPRHLEDCVLDYPLNQHTPSTESEEPDAGMMETLPPSEGLHSHHYKPLSALHGTEQERWQQMEARLKDVTRQMSELQTAMDNVKRVSHSQQHVFTSSYPLRYSSLPYIPAREVRESRRSSLMDTRHEHHPAQPMSPASQPGSPLYPGQLPSPVPQQPTQAAAQQAQPMYQPTLPTLQPLLPAAQLPQPIQQVPPAPQLVQPTFPPQLTQPSQPAQAMLQSVQSAPQQQSFVQYAHQATAYNRSPPGFTPAPFIQPDHSVPMQQLSTRYGAAYSAPHPGQLPMAQSLPYQHGPQTATYYPQYAPTQPPSSYPGQGFPSASPAPLSMKDMAIVASYGIPKPKLHVFSSGRESDFKLPSAYMVAKRYVNDPTPYTSAIHALEQRYGQLRQLVQGELKAILDSPPVKPGDTHAFQEFSSAVNTLVGMLSNMDGPAQFELRCGSHVDTLLSRLPISYRDSFTEYCLMKGIIRSGSDQTYTLPDLAEWLDRKAQVIQVSQSNPTEFSRTVHRDNKPAKP